LEANSQWWLTMLPRGFERSVMANIMAFWCLLVAPLADRDPHADAGRDKNDQKRQPRINVMPYDRHMLSQINAGASSLMLTGIDAHRRRIGRNLPILPLFLAIFMRCENLRHLASRRPRPQKPRTGPAPHRANDDGGKLKTLPAGIGWNYLLGRGSSRCSPSEGRGLRCRATPLPDSRRPRPSQIQP
jgi:hypothetical protein